MSVARALDIIQTDLEHSSRADTFNCVQRQPLQQISVTKDGFQFLDIGMNDRGFWKDSYSVMAAFRFENMPYLQTGPLKGRPGVTVITNWPQPAMSPVPTRFIAGCVGLFPAGGEPFWGFIGAVNRMIWEQTPEAAEWRHDEETRFEQAAAAWRALPVKPPISDDVTKKRLLAEDAISQKDIGSAVRYYEEGVALDPTWAPGWFNVALLYAEQNDYVDAASSMKRYLILLPDAPDASAANDKVLLWEAKAEEAAGK